MPLPVLTRVGRRRSDGPYQYENDIADKLNGGKGTFFLNGNNYVCIYDRIDQVRALHAAYVLFMLALAFPSPHSSPWRFGS